MTSAFDEQWNFAQHFERLSCGTCRVGTQSIRPKQLRFWLYAIRWKQVGYSRNGVAVSVLQAGDAGVYRNSSQSQP